MQIPTEIIFDAEVFLQGSRAQTLRTWSAVAAGTIIEMHLWAEDVLFSNKYFNVKKSNANLFSFAERLVVTSSVLEDHRTGLEIPVTFGEPFSLDLVQIGTGRIYTPITLLIVTEV